jgi:hypothetical protein
MSTSLAVFAVDAHLAEGQVLRKKRTKDKGKSKISSRNANSFKKGQN